MITYRKILVSDFQNFNTLYKKIESESDFMLYEKDERKTTDEQQKAFLETLAKNPSTTIIVAEHNNILVGFIGIICESQKKRKHSRYVAMGILEKFQGQKIGSKLMSECIAFCVNQKVKRIELTVICENTKAVSLYKKFGFEVEGIKKCSLSIHGRYVDEYYMSRVN